MEALREKLKKRGAQGIRGLARNFKICDRDGSRSLDVQELAKCCSMCKLGLSLEQVRTLHGFFDRGGDGYISFDEFLKAIRGSLSPTRRKLVTKVFNALDAAGDQNGYLTIEDLQHAYSAVEHPDVKGGRRTEKEVLLDLLEVFEGSGSDSSKKGDGIVTLDEWIGYYEEVSSSIDTDDYFGAMITRCWSALKITTADGRVVPAVSYVSARELNNVEAILRTSIYQKAKRGMSEARTVDGWPSSSLLPPRHPACNPMHPACIPTHPACNPTHQVEAVARNGGCELLRLLGRALPAQSSFFINFLLQVGWLSPLAELLHPGLTSLPWYTHFIPTSPCPTSCHRTRS